MNIRSTFVTVLFAAATLTVGHAHADVPPTDQQIAETIERGVQYLKATQAADGHWDEPSQGDVHRLGATALAGLALLENGVSRDDSAIALATKLITNLALENDQTYDLALAILYLARVQTSPRGPSDPLIQSIADRLAHGGTDGAWSYTVPRDRVAPTDPPPPEPRQKGTRARRKEARQSARRNPFFMQQSDNSNTQFALLGIWAAGRHGFEPDEPLEAIDQHFRTTQLSDGHWGYRPGMPAKESMTCAGLMGLAIAAARPSLAERQTARARGAALAADPLFISALHAVASDARRSGLHSDIYYLWSLERVCVALGLRSLEGFDWYNHGASILIARQEADGGWPRDQWGRLSGTSLALLFLRKANLAFELDRVLRISTSDNDPVRVDLALSNTTVNIPPAESQPPDSSHDTAQPTSKLAADNAKADSVSVIVTGANQQAFPKISVQFEVKKRDGSYLLDAARDQFRVSEEGRDLQVLDFQAPISTEAIPTTIVLVIDHSLSMEEENRIVGMKQAVASFMERLPTGSKVAVIAFSTRVQQLGPFTTDRKQILEDVSALQPEGATRFYDAVTQGISLLNEQTGRRALLALTDGEDTFSQSATLQSSIADAQRLGLPIYTVGLGTEEEIESADLKKLATATRGQYYPARDADQLRSIYEKIADRIGQSYTLTYKSDRQLPDGTLRPVQILYTPSSSIGETAVFIPGMVVPASGWSPLFLGLSAFLLALLTRFRVVR
jgi:VWFA-related protein